MKLKAARCTDGLGLLHVTLFILACFLDACAAEDKSISTNVSKKEPIVIQTQVQNYDQPTLTEYQQCQENRSNCLTVCEAAGDVDACEKECPNCPILISQDIVIQGINDTDHSGPAVKPVNTTNIIRLTNEIRNIIDNNNNLTSRNENNIHIHQNISSIGGEFGLGFNDKGSCCIVVRSASNCDSSGRFSSAARCHHKRQRFCGEVCKARVMYAKRVTHCEGGNDGACKQRIEYIPYATYRKRRSASAKCHPTQVWPFVACPKRHEPHRSQQCRRCLQLPYGYILRNGVPPQCMSCYGYGGYSTGMSNYPPQALWYPTPGYIFPEFYPALGQERHHPSNSPNYDWDDGLLPEADGWTIENTKCQRPDGVIIENCHVDNDNNTNNNVETGSGDDNLNLGEIGKNPGDPLGVLPEAQDEIFETSNDYNYNENYKNDVEDYPEYYDVSSGVEAVRRRRQAFRRSAYSRRNRQRNIN